MSALVASFGSLASAAGSRAGVRVEADPRSGSRAQGSTRVGTERLGPTETSEADDVRRTDEELLVSYRDTRSAEDFRELVQRYERPLYRYLVRYLGGNHALADEVFQNTFLGVHLRIGLYGEGRPAQPWLYAIATHQAIDTLRRSAKQAALSLDRQPSWEVVGSEAEPLRDRLVGDAEGPLARLQEQEQHDWVQRRVAELPEPLRQALVLAYFEDRKYREIAEIQNVPIGTVKSRLHLALARLQKQARAARLLPDDCNYARESA